MFRMAVILMSCLFAISPFPRREKGFEIPHSERDMEQDKVTASSKSQIPSQTSSGCLSYESSVVTLNGTIIRKTFPGPPNYESVRRGDKPEVYWLIVLSRPICVDKDELNPDLNPAQTD